MLLCSTLDDLLASSGAVPPQRQRGVRALCKQASCRGPRIKGQRKETEKGVLEGRLKEVLKFLRETKVKGGLDRRTKGYLETGLRMLQVKWRLAYAFKSVILAICVLRDTRTTYSFIQPRPYTSLGARRSPKSLTHAFEGLRCAVLILVFRVCIVRVLQHDA